MAVPSLAAGTGQSGVLDGAAWKRWVNEGVGAPFEASGRFEALRRAADDALKAATSPPTRTPAETLETLKAVLHVLTHGRPATSSAAPPRAPVEQRPRVGAGVLLCGAVLVGAASALLVHRSRSRTAPAPVPQAPPRMVGPSPARERPPAAPERPGSSLAVVRPGPSPARERPGPSPARERLPLSHVAVHLPPRPLPSPLCERPPAAAAPQPAVREESVLAPTATPTPEPQLKCSSSFLSVDDPLDALAALSGVPEHRADALLQGTLLALPTPKLAAALAALPVSHAAAALACLPVSVAGAALTELPPETAGTILVACETPLGVGLVAEGLSHRTAAMAIAYAQPAAAAAALLAAMNAGLRLSLMAALQLDEDVSETTPIPLAQLSPHAAADMLSAMDPAAAAPKIGVLTEPDIAAVLSCMPLDAAAAIMSLLPAAQCAAVLESRGAKAAGCALETMDAEAAALVLQAMPHAVAKDILAAMASRPRHALLARLPMEVEEAGDSEELALALQRLATAAERAETGQSSSPLPSPKLFSQIPAFEI